MSSSNMMPVARLTQTADRVSLRFSEEPVPSPGRGQVLVRMGAASLNYLDLLIRSGSFSSGAAQGIVPLTDGAGVVVETGADVTRWSSGDAVIGTFFTKWIAGPLDADGRADLPGATRDGMLRRYALFDEEALVAAPPHLSAAESATLPCAALTAWDALFGGKPLLPGDVVLTQGSGGVSLFALQFAKAAGARVIVTTSSGEKGARLREIGADEVVNYRTTPDWHQEVRELTAGRGADHIVEIGGAGSLHRSVKAAAASAQINMVGLLEPAQHVDPSLFMEGVVTIRRISVGSRASFEAMNKAIAHHKLRPIIDSTFDFKAAEDAYRHLEAQRHFGKIVIALDR